MVQPTTLEGMRSLLFSGLLRYPMHGCRLTEDVVRRWVVVRWQDDALVSSVTGEKNVVHSQGGLQHA